jgi:hypothetical protein
VFRFELAFGIFFFEEGAALVVVWETVSFEDNLGGEGERHREDPWRRERQIMVRFLIFIVGSGGLPEIIG